MYLEWCEEEKGTFYDALRLWGNKSQIDVAAEEAAELIKVLMKSSRRRNGATADDVIDEMADVYVMLGQLELIFDPKGNKIRERYNFKLNRLHERIKSWKP